MRGYRVRVALHNSASKARSTSGNIDNPADLLPADLSQAPSRLE